MKNKIASEVLLRQAVEAGIKELFPNGLPENYRKRVEYELDVIIKMGYADYHLIVMDFLEYGRLLGFVPKDKVAEAPLTIPELKSYIQKNGWKNRGFAIGPGRGSAVGSLVCHLIGITALDPIKYGLLFERFLNIQRASMPDIDSDIATSIRAKLIEYVKHKYGEKAVCGIMTIGLHAPKKGIATAAKYYGLKEYNQAMTSLGKTISKDIPSAPGVSFNSMVDIVTGKLATEDTQTKVKLSDYLCSKYQRDKDALQIIRWATIIEGTMTEYGAHAAGIVISDNQDVSDYIPLRYNDSLGMFTTQCNMTHVEENGLLKFDFLGLKTLDIITDTLRMIEKNHGIIIEPTKIDLEDKAVYRDIFSAGRTNAVFQFESSGMKAMLKRFKPERFEDLIILVSMFRPGPLQYLDGVIEVKNGLKNMTFLCDELEPILGKTYGAIVYQEQVMQICQSLAGFTLGHADEVRRYMSKKKADKLAHEKEAFIDGCKKNGIPEQIADTLFGQMMDFARYAFNKSHAAAYALNAYITGWLKKYYPAEFLAAALNWAETSKYPGLMNEATAFDVAVRVPDINLSEKTFTVADGSILFGLSSVAGVKDNADGILEARKHGYFKDMADFLTRVNPKSTVVNNLISAGAMDSFGNNRKAMKEQAAELAPYLKTKRDKESFIKSASLVLPEVERLSADELAKRQTDAGLKVEIKESTTYAKLEKRIQTAKETYEKACRDIQDIKPRNIEESLTERMNEEKKFLGKYVTNHPMDFSEPVEGAVPIEEMSEDTTCICGVVDSVSIKERKKDGKKMAFITVDDKSGLIDVLVFTKEYQQYASIIEEGKVLALTGETQVEEGDDGELEKKFIAKSMRVVNERKPSLLMSIPSYEQYKNEIEQSFREIYEQPDGYKLLILDKATGHIYEPDYKVNGTIKMFPAVEVKI